MSKWSVKKPLYITKRDKRYAKHLKQLKERGFSDTETWSLYSVLSEFILPRLKRFKEVTNGFPSTGDMTMEKWYEILDKMIFSFEWALFEDEDADAYGKLSEEEIKENWGKYAEGMKLFAEYFRDLWW